MQAGRPGNQNRGCPQAGNSGRNGSFHCAYNKRSGKCDFCKRMVERSEVISTHFGVKHSIAGNNVHLPATQKEKFLWFIYLLECIHPEGRYQYVGSTISVTHRWANTKSKIISLASNPSLQAGTGFEKHFKEGCSQYRGQALESVRVTLLETFVTNKEKTTASNHKAGEGCRCSECEKLKELEDKWICRLGTFHGQFGLNERDEMKRRSRAGY